MSEQYLILKRIQVSGANAISGFTYGFPAVTHFLGYVHALSLKLQHNHKITLSDVAIICHHHQLHAYRESRYEPYAFAQTRNPLTKEGKTAPINEEGKMNMSVSLIIRASGFNVVNEAGQKAQCELIRELAIQQKLAGGRITGIQSCFLSSGDTPRKLLRPLLPGFALIDRSALLAEKNQKNKDNQMLENWLSFSAFKYAATDEPLEEDPDKVKWQQVDQHEGYLVPIQIGYKQLAKPYSPREVSHVRNPDVPVSFVEAIHSIGEWIGAPSRLDSLSELMWQYHYQEESPFYVCHSQQTINAISAGQDTDRKELDFGI
ncbi:type I-F CRISPR-associated protein Csy2 [Vibrio mangrovi]|uniref:CRISPR-associated protein Csy2 n=1 Tax=Vibrio mangrovi TaxID=474394 RepID=A0A1Y6IYZ4_9VIBR|nr:type I-F CRISPR-associated protein Csy2 [Vibrio mangrovi]MDW6005270.1 type I-F CRISPR-associated protein Csy2 [Vibrio mangrovi]SMS02895.1 CRISPR-associated protein Csy2 [Vibrio mangrovi]